MFTENERIQYENAQKSYEDIQRRKAALTGKDERLFKRIEAVQISQYDDVNVSVILTIANVYSNNAINAFNTIFKLGFMKGQRAIERQMQKEIRIREA